MGRSVGVIHAAGAQHRSFADDTVRDLEILANLAGGRIGMLRVMSETQLQATTDSLTGLLNRRSFEDKAAALRRRESLMSVAMADLDHFNQAPQRGESDPLGAIRPARDALPRTKLGTPPTNGEREVLWCSWQRGARRPRERERPSSSFSVSRDPFVKRAGSITSWH